MPRLDHISLPVRDWRVSRDWWRDKLGFEVEFELEGPGVAAMRDEADLTVFLGQADEVTIPSGLALTIQVSDVEVRHAALKAAGVAFEHGPQKVFWGYGAQLRDPNGYVLRLWDEASMKANGGG
ncbi:MAG TPA: VOC family protein [Caulobacteraceae bacterium]|nr:VOC family protein [Caulobacteraceae bacterium]